MVDVEISDRIRISEIRTMAESATSIEELRGVVTAMAERIDLILQDLYFQLKRQPTIYTVDPEDPANASLVSGAKTGDVAVYVKEGNVRIFVFS